MLDQSSRARETTSSRQAESHAPCLSQPSQCWAVRPNPGAPAGSEFLDPSLTHRQFCSRKSVGLQSDVSGLQSQVCSAFVTSLSLSVLIWEIQSSHLTRAGGCKGRELAARKFTSAHCFRYFSSVVLSHFLTGPLEPLTASSLHPPLS